MTEPTRYALWLLPENSANDIFLRLINDLSEQYRGPQFAPHITLFGRTNGIESQLTEAVEKLAEKLAPFKISTQGIEGTSYYFRCLYVKLAKSAELLRIGQLASEALGAGLTPNYIPHVSLLYGTLKRKTRAQLRSTLTQTVPPEFGVDRLQLVQLAVSVTDWRPVTTCTFSGH